MLLFLQNLNICDSYEIIIQPVTPSGHVGVAVLDVLRTGDAGKY